MKRTPIIDHDTGEVPVFSPPTCSTARGVRRASRPVACRPAACSTWTVSWSSGSWPPVAPSPIPSWPCFHTKLHRWRTGDEEIGVIGGTVGGPFAVLVAEELFASGCEALVSISSAGLVASDATPPLFVLIERALRDEGTSYHYLPSARYAAADPALTDAVARALSGTATPLLRGASWTTDAPFRESASLIAERRVEGILSVEMEAAALLAMGRALRRPVACLAHVTNTMATRPDDFEKGGHGGQEEALDLCAAAVRAAVEHVRSSDAG